MGYVIVKRPSRETVPVEDGKWVAERRIEHYSHAPQNVPLVLGITPDDWSNGTVWTVVVSRDQYTTGNGGWADHSSHMLIADKPFAVLTINVIAGYCASASLLPARQIHRGELGREAPIDNLPAVWHDQSAGGNPRHWVHWMDVAMAYGENDPSKLWQEFIPFSRKLPVCYQGSKAFSRVCYPQRLVGRSLEHYSPWVPASEAEVEERIAKMVSIGMGPEGVQRVRNWFREKDDHLRSYDAAIAAGKILPQEVLWDDPVLRLERMSVPLAFAKDVLRCKQFGYHPNFEKMIADAAHQETRR